MATSGRLPSVRTTLPGLERLRRGEPERRMLARNGFGGWWLVRVPPSLTTEEDRPDQGLDIREDATSSVSRARP